ncbi:HpcH/HpaI aldolase/citrate lyase family protein [Castellaniella caeni]|uniref:HpcH/HpaI aldolase/citrate lyase family protein n=1 Tax=Castellaniella caeni TaxID=266123 RepID=UPI00082FA3CD|nr:CoA ester lyase [Castellaniella caeni]
MHDTLMRTALFVPATRPERFPKAVASGADAVIVDLEDSVAPEAKAQARDALARFAAEHPNDPVWVRINDGTTPWFDDDLALCRSLPSVAGIVLPKAQAAEHVYIVSGAGKPLMPVIESASGLRVLDRIAEANGVVRLSFGILDLMVEFGTRPQTEGAQRILDQIRFQILQASRMHGLADPLDTVYANFSDTDGLRQSATLARDMGFGGMLCIHPSQIAVVHEVYRPQPDEITWAQRVVDHADDTGDYTFRLDGHMIDLPLIERARRVLERSV